LLISLGVNIYLSYTEIKALPKPQTPVTNHLRLAVKKVYENPNDEMKGTVLELLMLRLDQKWTY